MTSARRSRCTTASSRAIRSSSIRWSNLADGSKVAVREAQTDKLDQRGGVCRCDACCSQWRPLLAGCTACLAQVSTMGTTAMGLPSTPGDDRDISTQWPEPVLGDDPAGHSRHDAGAGAAGFRSDNAGDGRDLFHTDRANHAWNSDGDRLRSFQSATGGHQSERRLSVFRWHRRLSARTTSTTAPLTCCPQQPATSFLTDFPGSTIPVPSSLQCQRSAVACHYSQCPYRRHRRYRGTASTSMAEYACPSATTMSSTRDDAMRPPLGTIPTPIRRQHDRDRIAGALRSAAHRPPYAALRREVRSTNGAALPLSTPDNSEQPAAWHDPTRVSRSLPTPASIRQ